MPRTAHGCMTTGDDDESDEWDEDDESNTPDEDEDSGEDEPRD